VAIAGASQKLGMKSVTSPWEFHAFEMKMQRILPASTSQKREIDRHG
jgi:hypothetical protein